MTTQTPSLNLLLGSSTSLHCGFSMAPGLGITSVEWHRQHKGSGHLVYRWATGQGQAKREGATLEPQQLLMAGDASLTLPSLTLKDEGTYICEITPSLYRAQQIIQLNVQGEARTQLCREEGERDVPTESVPEWDQTQGRFPERQTAFPQPQCRLHPRSADGIRWSFPSGSR